MADQYIYGQTERVSREAPVLIVRYESGEVKLGGGANAAANVKSLGGKVTAVGAVGRDEMGKALRQKFSREGIRLVAENGKGIRTETKMRILAGGFNTTRQQMLRLDSGNEGELPPVSRMRLARLVQHAVDKADAVVVSDYGAGVVSDEVRRVLLAAAKKGVFVCIDSRYALGSFIGATVCKPNEPELEALTGIRLRTTDDVVRAGKRAVELLRCRALLLTRGRHGMAVFDEYGRVEWIPVHGAKEAVDVTGAGDTVVASFALALASGASALEAARLANIAGALVVQKQGTATISREELLGEILGLSS